MLFYSPLSIVQIVVALSSHAGSAISLNVTILMGAWEYLHTEFTLISLLLSIFGMFNLPLQFYCKVFAPSFFIVVVLNWVMSRTQLFLFLFSFFTFFFFHVYGFFITMYVSVDFLTWCPLE